MATKKPSKKEIDSIVPEFVSTFGSSLKLKAKENATSQSKSAGGNAASQAQLPQQPKDALKVQPPSPPSAFNSMQILPSSPVKQALAKAQHSFGSIPTDRPKDSASSPVKHAIEVPEFISTYPLKLKSHKASSPPASSISSSPAAAVAAALVGYPAAAAPASAPLATSCEAVSSDGISEDLIDSVMKEDLAESVHAALSDPTAADATSAADLAPQQPVATAAQPDTGTSSNAVTSVMHAAVDSATRAQAAADDQEAKALHRKAERRKRKAAAALALESDAAAAALSAVERQKGVTMARDDAAGVGTLRQQQVTSSSNSAAAPTLLPRSIDVTSSHTSSSSPTSLAGKGKASWWRQSQLRRFVLRLPQQRNFSCQFETAAMQAPASGMQVLEEQLRAAEIGRAAAAAEAVALGVALQRHHESANTELHLSDRSTRALTTHMKMLQDQLQALRASSDASLAEKAAMHESLGAAKDEIRRLREVEAAGVRDRELQLQTSMRNEELREMRAKFELQAMRLQEDLERVRGELKEAKENARCAGDRAVAEAAAAAVVKLREEKCAGELVSVRRQLDLMGDASERVNELVAQLEASKAIADSERARSDGLFQQLQALQSKNADLSSAEARASAAERRAADIGTRLNEELRRALVAEAERDAAHKELKLCNSKLKDAETEIANSVERGRAKAKLEQESALAILREALAAAEKRSDSVSAALDAAAAVARMRDEKEIDLRSHVAALQKQQADMAAAAAAAAAAATKRDGVVASLEQRLRESLANASELQRSAARAAAAAAADKDASERRLQDAEAKIQEMVAEMDRKDEEMRTSKQAASQRDDREKAMRDRMRGLQDEPLKYGRTTFAKHITTLGGISARMYASNSLGATESC